MTWLLSKTVSVLMMILGIGLLILPDAMSQLSGSDFPLSTGAARAIGAGLLLLGFVLFRAKSQASDSSARPAMPIGYMLQLLKAKEPDLTDRFPEGELLETTVGHLLQRRKIQAVKVVRKATSRDLKAAKELVDELERAIERVRT